MAALPAARAGPIFQLASMSGKFQGTIRPTTPIGSRRVKSKPGLETGMVSPMSLLAAPAQYSITLATAPIALRDAGDDRAGHGADDVESLAVRGGDLLPAYDHSERGNGGRCGRFRGHRGTSLGSVGSGFAAADDSDDTRGKWLPSREWHPAGAMVAIPGRLQARHHLSERGDPVADTDELGRTRVRSDGAAGAPAHARRGTWPGVAAPAVITSTHVRIWLGVVLAAIAIGTTGYMLLDPGWRLIDALYMTVITLRSEERRVGKECRSR